MEIHPINLDGIATKYTKILIQLKWIRVPLKNKMKESVIYVLVKKRKCK